MMLVYIYIPPPYISPTKYLPPIGSTMAQHLSIVKTWEPQYHFDSVAEQVLRFVIGNGFHK